MGRAASRYVASPTPKRRSVDTSPTLLRSGASRPFIAGTYNGCVYYPLRTAGPKTRDRAPSVPTLIVHVVHEENLSPPCTVIKERRVSHLCWHGGAEPCCGNQDDSGGPYRCDLAPLPDIRVPTLPSTRAHSANYAWPLKPFW